MTLHRVTWLLHGLCQPMGQSPERLLEDYLQQLGLILEVDVNRRRRVLDFVGNPPHGHVFIAIPNKQLARGIQDLLPEELLLPRPPFLYSHVFPPTSLT